MALGKRRTGRKGAAKKTAGKPKPRKRAETAAKPGIGHNKPPEPPVPHKGPPHRRFWPTEGQMGAEMRRQGAARRRAHGAAMRSMSVGPVAPSLAITSDPRQLHGLADPIVVYGEMRKRIAALEETIANLPTAPGALLTDNETDEIKSEIATLKTLPPVPAKPPTEAAGAQSRLATFGEKVLVGLTTTAVSEASKALWAQYGDQLIALARAIGEWIASLPPPSP